MEWPYAPALPYTAAPTEPGMPASVSSPFKPARDREIHQILQHGAGIAMHARVRRPRMRVAPRSAARCRGSPRRRRSDSCRRRSPCNRGRWPAPLPAPRMNASALCRLGVDVRRSADAEAGIARRAARRCETVKLGISARRASVSSGVHRLIIKEARYADRVFRLSAEGLAVLPRPGAEQQRANGFSRASRSSTKR